MGSFRKDIVAAVVTLVALPGCSNDAAGREQNLHSWLQDHVRTGADTESVRYSTALVDLNADGSEEAIVYLRGENPCGSGGCNALVLAPEGRS
jgi:hypothetical protein